MFLAFSRSVLTCNLCPFCFQLTLTIVRQTGGLGISIAGGKGSTPYKGDDEVRPPNSVIIETPTFRDWFSVWRLDVRMDQLVAGLPEQGGSSPRCWRLGLGRLVPLEHNSSYLPAPDRRAAMRTVVPLPPVP